MPIRHKILYYGGDDSLVPKHNASVTWELIEKHNTSQYIYSMYMYWDGFLVVHQTPNAKNMYSQPTRHSWWPLLPFLLSLCTARIAVPGYSQVSAGRKDLFFCFASPVSVVSWGEGRGGVTSVRGLALNPLNGLSLALHGGSTLDVHSVHSLPPPLAVILFFGTEPAL